MSTVNGQSDILDFNKTFKCFMLLLSKLRFSENCGVEKTRDEYNVAIIELCLDEWMSVSVGKINIL